MLKRHKMKIFFGVCMAAIVGLWAMLPVPVRRVQAEESVRLPILMYHSVQVDEMRAGQYVIPMALLESDLRLLKERGYTAVTVSDLVAYVQNGTPLPEKPVMLTFDDGHYNVITNALPLLQQYEMKAVIAVVGAYIERSEQEHDLNPRYAYMDWEAVQQAQQSGWLEVQSHSYDLHASGKRQGANRMRGESDADYRAVLEADLLKMQGLFETYLGHAPTAFLYPLGAHCDLSEQILQEKGFLATFSCYEHINYITRDPQSLFLLGRYNRPAGISSEAFFKGLLP